jgi:hypothetical protein
MIPMLINTHIFKKYASIEDYNRFVEDSIASFQTKFPNVKLHNFGEFKSFLDNLIPKLIHKYLILSGSMKNCSGIAPDFAEIAAQAGFPVFTMIEPGHQLNLLLATEGPYLIDLSYIQFTCKNDMQDKSSRQEVINNYKELYQNPFKALSIKALPKQHFSNIRFPHGVYSSFSPDPMRTIQDYDIKETEEIFPERFEKLKS